MLFAGFGLFHGSAFGSGIAGLEGNGPGSLRSGYLIGLGVVQYALALAAGSIGVRWLLARRSEALSVRLAGAAVAGIGLFLGLETTEAALLASLTPG